MQVGLDTGGVASEEGGAGASGAETGWTGSAQNKLAPKTQKSGNESEISTAPGVLDLKHTRSHGDAGRAPDALGFRRLKFPLSLEQHLDLEMYRRSKQKSTTSTRTLHRRQQQQHLSMLSLLLNCALGMCLYTLCTVCFTYLTLTSCCETFMSLGNNKVVGLPLLTWD